MEFIVHGWPPAGAVESLYTCDGANLSPALEWRDLPAETRSLVLWMVDPDAPSGFFLHWLLFNLPPDDGGLPQGVRELPDGTREGTNNFGSLGYAGPCPPPGKPHRYRFELFALDGLLQLSDGVTQRHVNRAMQHRVLATARVESLYEREPSSMLREAQPYSDQP